MKANDQCNRCGIDRDVHDLRPAPDHAFVEHRAELVAAQRTIERLRGELAEAVELVKKGPYPHVFLCAHATIGGDAPACGKCWPCRRDTFLASLAAPPPAESTPVQVPIYEDGKRMDGPAATLSLKNPAAINRTTPGTTTCELCMQNDADRPAAFQCDGCAEYSCIEHAAAHRCLTTPAAPPDDIRAFTPPLTAREWMMDHERRLAALEAKGAAPWCYSVDCRYYGQRHVTAHEPREDHPKGAKP